MRFSLNKILFFVFYCILHNTQANVIIINNLNDNNANGTLRYELNNTANNGDTLFISVKGTIYLNNTLNINKNVTIYGFYPVHTTIAAASVFSGSTLLDITSSVKIEQLGIVNLNNVSNLTGLSVQSGNNLYIKNVNIKQFTARGIINSGALHCTNVSFISNSVISTGAGGAVLNNNPGLAEFINCTFYNNSAFQGGAVSNYDQVKFIHNTFHNNTASSGAHINNQGNAVTIQNNIFTGISPSALNNAASTWNNNGGNVYSFTSPGSFLGVTTSDIFNATINLRSNILTDGYGLEYFTLQNNSTAIDAGTFGPEIPATDCRRAPRVLHGGTAQKKPDAGACEYTPFTVTNMITNDFLNRINAINLTTLLSPYYVDFDIPSPGTFSYNSIVNINKNHVIIDGYTQPGSAIWGPGTAISTTTPFILPITINFTSFSSTGLNIINDSCSVSGVKISSTNSAFTINNADYFHLFGSQIFNCNFGIHAQYTENTLIGGLALHSKNVIQDCDSAGIYFSSSHQAVITNNFIGTDLAGNNPAPCNIGVKIINSSYINLPGDYRWFSGNLISGNDEAGIDIINSSNVFVLGNFIGTDRLGLNALPNKTGVIIRNNSDSVYVGVNTLAGRNLISGNDNHGIEISNFNNQSFLSISNNYIGTNYFGNAALANEDDGIFIQNKLNGNTLIKNNLISGNDENGVNISSSNYISLSGNIIGLNTSQTAVLANGNSGVYAENSYFLNIGLTTDNRNIISGNTQQGIHFNNVDYSSILNSYIGISNNGSSFGNIEHGILVENGSYAINIGSHTDSLIVANNNAHGIYIRGTSDGVDIKPFRIENNGLLGISLDNNNTPNPNPNDTDDTDTGPNGLQNYPLIQVKNCGNTTNASGMLYIDAGIGYRLDFFLSSSPPDPSQHGEAGKFLYTYIFTTGITGIYNFDITLPYVPTGSYVTATASKQISSGVMATSEFSLNTQVSLVNIVPNVTVTEPLCFNDITGAINVSPSGGVQPYIFSLYDVGNVQIGTSFTGNNYYHNLLGAGTYYLHIQESAGCAMIDTIIINQPQALTLNLSVNNETCLGFNDGSVILSASGGTSPYQFSQDGVNYNTITQYANLSPGVYTFYVTDNNNCNVNQSATINQGVAQPLPPIFNPSIYEFCLTAQPVTANANYTVYWYTDSTLTNLIYTGNPYTTMIPGWVTYYVTQELNNCHSNPSTVSILLINEQLVQDGSPYYGCSDLPVQINVGVSAPGSTIQWSSAAEISDLASFTPLITAAASNSYFYNVNIPYLSGNSTCIITDSIYVEINNSPDCGLTSTYNAFSPNGDGINDVWIIDGAYFYPLNRVTIFNRWGNKLLNFNNYDNRNVVWDGSYKGEILPSGTYFYLIEFIEVNKSITGWVQITR